MTLHLVRTVLPPGVVAEGDIVVYLCDLTSGAIDHDHLVELIFTAARTITW